MPSRVLSYPIPILGNADDLEGELRCNGRYRLQAESVEIQIDVGVLQPDIEKLLSERRAAYALQIQCPQTFYRSAVQSGSSSISHAIPANRVTGLVAIRPVVVACVPIPSYSPTKAHADYANASFAVDTGDLLARGPETYIFAEKEFDASTVNVSSIMRIKEDGESPDGPMWLDLSEDRIIVYLAQVDWAHYNDLKGDRECQKVFHSAIVVPALVDALQHLEDPESQGLRWQGILTVLVDRSPEAKTALEDEDPLVAAQILLKNPLARTMDAAAVLTGGEE